MNILIIEPYYTGSHAVWANSYRKYSRHNVEILSMDGRFWKWRMHGGAIHLAKEFLSIDFNPDLIIATDMLDLTTFIALAKEKLDNTKICMYFHENQLSYPWSPRDKDVQLKRDLHYGFINYSSVLASDYIFFNSKYHMDSFLNSLYSFLKSMPDYRGLDNIKLIKKKGRVLNLGLDLEKFDKYKDIEKIKEPLIIWNHRWEYDKNPDDFFKALKIIKNKGVNFKVAVLGKDYKEKPKSFLIAKEELKDNIVAFGMTKEFSDYAKWLNRADILPVTSNQEFFGISVMEAIYCNCYPILPKRLTYPELIPYEKYKSHFYHDFNELVGKLETAIKNINEIRKISLRPLASKYNWKVMVKLYDNLFEKVVSK
ncbi:tRNA-queuosine alpha-mannosyltransferase domain-containing protein [Thermohalobacter berrensis]|uniref:tRNA-queuosine alpha-mannosyltransferase n=1 Tax=Thermohalobacter berrensis TaxID=99594 RepID=A0A419SW93_9FIRM|nr:DUF3524 domain-containing protein [Thermohalobacter berrensis]RKD29513.1 glycosyl transferase family 1 [Thermohalobacter berrensis]